MKILTRLSRALAMLREDCEFMEFMHGSDYIEYEIYSIMSELEFDRSLGKRVIAPNELGARLILVGWEIRYLAEVARYVVTGTEPEYWRTLE